MSEEIGKNGDPESDALLKRVENEICPPEHMAAMIKGAVTAG